MVKERIICAAIYFDNDIVYHHQPINIMSGFVVAAFRHHNVYNTLSILNIDRFTLGDSVQGFLTSKNRFVDRAEAAKLAYDCGQITEIKNKLYSEDLY